MDDDRLVYYKKIMEEERPAAVRLARWVTTVFNPRGVIDFGSATGLYIEPFACHTLGLEIDETAVCMSNTNVIQCDLTQYQNFGQYDVGISLEVAEHIQEDKYDSFLANISRHVTRYLVFSAAGLNQTEPLHVNLQPKQFWIDKLTQHGFCLHQYFTNEMLAYMQAGYHMGWFRQNAFCMAKQS